MVLFYPLAKPVALLLDALLKGQELLPNCEAELVTMLERQVKQGIIDEEVRCLAWIGWSMRCGVTGRDGRHVTNPTQQTFRWGARCGGR